MHRPPFDRATAAARALALATSLVALHSLSPVALAQSADSVPIAPGIRVGPTGSSRAVIDSLDVQRSAASTLSELLQARAASVGVMMSGGTLTDGGRILIRGPSTVSTSGVPLLVVDGMRMADQQDDSTSTASRLDDVALEDIARIEILRGPAAAALFGAGASSGVIVVTTKRGAGRGWHVGARAFAEGRQATSSFPRNFRGLGSSASSTSPVSCPLAAIAEGGCTRTSLIISDPLSEASPLRTGAGGRASVDASGGSETGAIRLSLTGRQARGIAPDDRLSQVFTRLNATQRLGRGVDVGAHGSWLGGTSQRSELGQVIMSGLGRSPIEDSRTSFTDDVQNAFMHPTDQHHDHLTVGGDVAWQPLTWLVVRGAVTRDRDHARSAKTLDYSSPWFAFNAPFAYRSEWAISTIRTSRATAQLRHRVPGISSTRGELIVGTERIVRGREHMDTLNVTPSGSVGAWSWSTASAVNNAVFLSERLSVGERSTFGAGVRRERDTRADTAFRLYPSADAVWIAPTSLRGGQIRVRVAYGESAQPFELFAVQPLPIVPSLFGSGVGDTEDIPERLRELEGGVDLEWGRGAVGATLYHRSQNLLEIVPAIVPYARSVFARDAHTRGVELDARAVVLERSGWRWELRAIASMLRNRVGGSVALSTSNFAFLEEGSPIYGVASADPSYSDANGDGLISRAELVQPTWNADPRPSTPTFEGALHSTVTLGSRLTFLAIVDRHSGHYANAGSEAMHCRQPNCRDGEDLEASLAEQARALDLQSGRLVFTNAGFTRLREMSVRWTLASGGGRARPFGDATLVVSGRDLATWTGWRGLDPEINTNRRGALIQTDVGGVPLPRRFSIGLEVGSGAR